MLSHDPAQKTLSYLELLFVPCAKVLLQSTVQVPVIVRYRDNGLGHGNITL